MAHKLYGRRWMSIPDYQTLMLPLLRIAAVEETTIPRAVDTLAKEFALTPAELTERIPSGKSPLFNSRAHWAKTYLLQAGLLEQPRRSWFRASENGKQVLARNPSCIDKHFLRQFPTFQAFLDRSVRAPTEQSPEGVREHIEFDADVPTLAPDERINQAVDEIEAALRDELLDRIFAIEPVQQRATFFELLVVQLLVLEAVSKGVE